MEYRTAIAYALILVLAVSLGAAWNYKTRVGRGERRLEGRSERGRRSRRDARLRSEAEAKAQPPL